MFFLLAFDAMPAGKHAFKATIVAYDPTYHNLKQASFVKNLEVTIAEARGNSKSPAFIKVIFEGFGKQQVSDDILQGRISLVIHGVRDKSCDEDHPHVLPELDGFQGSGTFVLNQAHRSQSFDAVYHLQCYRVKVGKSAHDANRIHPPE